MMRRLAVLIPLWAVTAAAQCVMCSRTAAAQSEARIMVIQQGIVILLVPPVAILTFFLYLAWKRRKA